MKIYMLHGKTYYKIINNFDTVLYVEISMDLTVIWYQVITDFDPGIRTYKFRHTLLRIGICCKYFSEDFL